VKLFAFGLGLSPEDKNALLAFLKVLLFQSAVRQK